MFVVVEGNLAAGKSLILQHLAACTTLPVHQEPIADWEPLLKRFYAGEEGAFAVQTKIMADLTVGQGGAQGDGVYERCAWTAPYTFNKVLRELDLLTAQESDLLRQANALLARPPEVLVYLRCDPDEAMRRLAMRDRLCERSVSLDYMRRMHRAYEAMIERIREAHPEIAVHTPGRHKHAGRAGQEHSGVPDDAHAGAAPEEEAGHSRGIARCWVTRAAIRAASQNGIVVVPGTAPTPNGLGMPERLSNMLSGLTLARAYTVTK